MRSLFSLVVAAALLGIAAPSHAAAPIDRHATITQAPADDVAAPPLDAFAPALVAAPSTSLSPVCLASSAPRPIAAPAAIVPLYLRDRALLL